jgi:hypothetical protein
MYGQINVELLNLDSKKSAIEEYQYVRAKNKLEL